MIQGALPGMADTQAAAEDVVMTPPSIALSIVRHFAPSGILLDPCRGNGAFSDAMPGCDWCEIREGVDFFAYRKPVDWIVSNPPYSLFSPFMRHAMTVAENIVWLIPINKAWNSTKLIREVAQWGGISETHVVASGSELGFPVGFAVGAVHYKRGFYGGMRLSFMEQAVWP